MEYNFRDIEASECEAMLNTASFRTAKSMPNAPHSYTLLKNWVNPEDFYSVVMYIRTNGTPKKFWKKTYIYYQLNGYEYWTMGFPLDTTILINKAKI